MNSFALNGFIAMFRLSQASSSCSVLQAQDSDGGTLNMVRQKKEQR